MKKNAKRDIIDTMENILAKLNEEQIKPVCETEGAVLVLAGAGSGKTRVLTSRIAYILEQGLATPNQILSITFTNKAAGEMRERLTGILGDTQDMWICTIHSMCVRILRRFGESLGIGSNFSIYSETERNNVIKKCIRELELNDEKLLKSAKYHIGNAKTLGLDPDQYAVRFKDEKDIATVTQIYERYNQHLQQSNSLDFDDLLLQTLRLLRKDKESCDFLADRFKYILVDEFQDTNGVQYNIIRMLASKHGNLFAVGDDDQSIYGWRGAEIKNILQFDKDYPAAKVFKLQRNYRSTGSILSLANQIIKHNGARREKTLWTDRGEGETPEFYQADEELGEALYASRIIAQAVRCGAKFSDFAILMRINALTRSYEQEFNKYGIPYKVFGGFRFFERKEIKDVLAYLRIISNPFDDEAFTRVINVPRRGIGERTVELLESAAADQGAGVYYAALKAESLPITVLAKGRVKQFAELIKELVISAQTESVDALVKMVIEKTNLREAYDDGTDEGDAKLANLDEYVASVEDFARLNPNAQLSEYLNQITLASDTDEMDDGDYVTLATIHAVKGLEFSQVFVCGLEDGIMPTSRADNTTAEMEEERRLMYVAITRAKDKLYLTRSKSRYLYGRREQTTPSRFLREAATVLPSIAQSIHTPPTTGYAYGNRSYGNNTYQNNYGNRYGAQRPQKPSIEEDFGYQSDVPSTSRAVGASPAKSYGGFGGYGGYGAKNQAAPKYTVGMQVMHRKYGLGTVYAVSNNGNTIQVGFENKGTIELTASLAPLTIVRK